VFSQKKFKFCVQAYSPPLGHIASILSRSVGKEVEGSSPLPSDPASHRGRRWGAGAGPCAPRVDGLVGTPPWRGRERFRRPRWGSRSCEGGGGGRRKAASGRRDGQSSGVEATGRSRGHGGRRRFYSMMLGEERNPRMKVKEAVTVKWEKRSSSCWRH
jgi:hypothetical protein